MPFGNYDHLGRFRMREQKKPVATHGAVVEIGDLEVDGEVENAIESIHRIADSKRAQEVFVRYAFRFFMGRNETIRDAKTLQEANQAYENGGGSLRELVISLMSSSSFLYRAPDL